MDWNRFYPIFPAPLPSIGIDAINVDITHSALFRLAETGADIVILPSLLKAFTKVSSPSPRYSHLLTMPTGRRLDTDDQSVVHHARKFRRDVRTTLYPPSRPSRVGKEEGRGR